jgi:hypothetical protein
MDGTWQLHLAMSPHHARAGVPDLVESFDVPQLKMTSDCFLCALGVVRKAVDTLLLGPRINHGNSEPTPLLRTHRCCN